MVDDIFELGAMDRIGDALRQKGVPGAEVEKLRDDIRLMVKAAAPGSRRTITTTDADGKAVELRLKYKRGMYLVVDEDTTKNTSES